MRNSGRRVELNFSAEQTKSFIDWLANDPEEYWGHTIDNYDINHGVELTKFVINGHELWDYSNQHHHVVIDGCYCPAKNAIVRSHGVEYEALDYCLYRLGF